MKKEKRIYIFVAVYLLLATSRLVLGINHPGVVNKTAYQNNLPRTEPEFGRISYDGGSFKILALLSQNEEIVDELTALAQAHNWNRLLIKAKKTSVEANAYCLAYKDVCIANTTYIKKLNLKENFDDFDATYVLSYVDFMSKCSPKEVVIKTTSPASYWAGLSSKKLFTEGINGPLNAMLYMVSVGHYDSLKFLNKVKMKYSTFEPLLEFCAKTYDSFQVSIDGSGHQKVIHNFEFGKARELREDMLARFPKDSLNLISLLLMYVNGEVNAPAGNAKDSYMKNLISYYESHFDNNDIYYNKIEKIKKDAGL